MKLDWKYILTILAAVAGVLAPIWLWQFDLRAKSLTVRLASSVAIQSPDATSIPDLVMSVEGVKIDSPVLSTLELINDGAKPIPATDFENALEISVRSSSTIIVRARISNADPVDLKAELDSSSQLIKLKPLLLNQNDKITIAVLTSGAPPKFLPRARIAGIPSVKFEDAITHASTWKFIALDAFLCLGALVMYFIFGAALASSFTASRPVRLTKGLSVCAMTVLAVCSANAIRSLFELMETEPGLANLVPVLLLVCALGLGTSYFALKAFSRVESGNHEGSQGTPLK